LKADLLMTKETVQYTLVETELDLQDFYDNNQSVRWMALDTEFIGEKRYETLLCLIQVATPKGFYLIDPIKLPHLKPFNQLLESEHILKITHAGENDYRLLNAQHDVVPRNVFDTQIAAGFVGHGYPISYSKLVERELNANIDKGYAATDWEARPLKRKQLEYAISDVVHLYDLYIKLQNKLIETGREQWVMYEISRWETPQYYVRDPYREALMNTMMQSLRQHKQIFLLRLYDWRRKEAQRLNHSKEMVLPSKFFAPIVLGIDMGKQALLDSRIIPDRVITQHWETLRDLYNTKSTPEELDILKRLPPLSKEDAKRDISMELLHVLVKYKCHESGIAPTLVLNKSDLTYAQPEDVIIGSEEHDWRSEFLGEAMVKWLNQRGELTVDVNDNKVVVRMK
jgi:ribonuclease D